MKTYTATYPESHALRVWALISAEIGCGTYPLKILEAMATLPGQPILEWLDLAEKWTAAYDAPNHGFPLSQRPITKDEVMEYGRGRTRVRTDGRTVELEVSPPPDGSTSSDYHNHRYDETHPRVMLALALGMQRTLLPRLPAVTGCPSCGEPTPHANATTCATCCEELERITP